MKLIVEPTDLAMSESCLHILLGAMLQDKHVNISLTSGESPKTLYRLMAPAVRDRPQFADVEYYLFDESPVPGEAHGPIWDQMQELFFKEAGIPEERIHGITPENWETFDWQIRQAGDIDVMVIGLGADGHFCSNVPFGTPLDSYTYELSRAKLAELNPNYPDNRERPYFYTMGPRSLMRVKHLVMIVNGAHKADILKRMLDAPISPELPASVLKLHPNFTVICDAEAASKLDLADYPAHRI